MSRSGMLALLALLALGVVACSPSRDGALQELLPEDALAGLESRLLDAEDFRLRYVARSSGAFETEISGEFERHGAGAVRLTGSGHFGGDPVDLRLTNSGGTLRGGNAQNSFEQPTPPDLARALILGLTRMGILHNLARLTAGQPPDHADGGVDDWVQPIEVGRLRDQAASEGAATGLGFGVQVSGERSAEAILWLDDRGLPVRRTQVVSFPGGTMEVVEEYEILRFDP